MIGKAAPRHQPESHLPQQRVPLKPLARGGVADVIQIKRLLPLPETTDELCSVAASLGALPSDVRLGALATETEIKALSANGQLAAYRILHFATHGALSGEIEGNAEPGLVLTPPATANELDDGYLTASEIATLKIDADWVILSACNTAGAGSANAELLSGMARAFFYAGARSLLVSHWAVNSDATVELITKTFAALQSGPTHWPRRGSAPFDDGADLEGRYLRASRDLGTVRPGR